MTKRNPHAQRPSPVALRYGQLDFAPPFLHLWEKRLPSVPLHFDILQGHGAHEQIVDHVFKSVESSELGVGIFCKQTVVSEHR